MFLCLCLLSIGQAAVTSLGSSARFYQLDTSSSESIKGFAEALRRDLPGQEIDLLVRKNMQTWESDIDHHVLVKFQGWKHVHLISPTGGCLAVTTVVGWECWSAA